MPEGRRQFKSRCGSASQTLDAAGGCECDSLCGDHTSTHHATHHAAPCAPPQPRPCDAADRAPQQNQDWLGRGRVCAPPWPTRPRTACRAVSSRVNAERQAQIPKFLRKATIPPQGTHLSRVRDSPSGPARSIDRLPPAKRRVARPLGSGHPLLHASISRVLSRLPGGDHFSRPSVARGLERATRSTPRGQRVPDWVGRKLLALARGGVCRAPLVTQRAVRSYRTVSPLPAAEAAGGLFSVALSLTQQRAGGRYPPPCPVVLGLSSRGGKPAPSGRLDARSVYPVPSHPPTHLYLVAEAL